MTAPDIRLVSDVAGAAAALFVDVMRRSVEARGRFVVALSGGSTPLPCYQALAHEQGLPWDSTWVVWGDERFVPQDHPDSNVGAARRAFLDQVGVPAQQILAWPYLATPEESAAAYATILREALGTEPILDLTLLGLGADGHTASLFPGTGAARSDALTLAVRPATTSNPRLTLGATALSRSRVVAFLVQGERKRAALRATFDGDGDLDRYPARAVSALERLIVLTDVADRGQPS
jgi:6-phosphogluconolactonase